MEHMENVISAVFEVESEAYQALTSLKNAPVTSGYIISQAALVKKSGERLTVEDAFDTGVETRDDALTGGLIGALAGILGGPLGMLMMGSLGALAGSVVDAGDAVQNASILEMVAGQFLDGEVAVIVLAQESDPSALDGAFSKFRTSMVREDAALVAEEVRRAQEVQEEMRREAKKRLREERSAALKRSLSERREKIRSDFEDLKKKLFPKA